MKKPDPCPMCGGDPEEIEGHWYCSECGENLA